MALIALSTNSVVSSFSSGGSSLLEDNNLAPVPLAPALLATVGLEAAFEVVVALAPAVLGLSDSVVALAAGVIVAAG